MSSIRSLHLLRVTRPSLSSHPFNHTQYIVHRGHRSYYHWQTSLGAAIEGTQNLIVETHTISGLPWFLTIPLVAFAVGAVFRLPFQVYTQRILRRRTESGPLLQAWNARLQDDVAREGVARSQVMSEVQKRQDRVLRRIYRKLGLQEWRLYSGVASFPVWLLAIDGVRRLCGGPRGLIGSLIAGPAGGHTTDSATLPPAAGDIVDAVADPATLSSVAETARTAAAAAVVDPSLRIEGCLWFTDLTVADPYHVLPLLLSATLVYNLLPKSGEQFSDRLRVAMGRRPRSVQAQTLSGADHRIRLGERAKATFYVSMVGLAAVIGPATLDLPAALHLYWLASSATSAGFARGLKAFMPVQSKLRERCTGVEFSIIRPWRRVLGKEET
ncbi:hypothetical protein FHL15_009860 [Xylaria flabelliformis]|uniref:Uncharacterized protein n=1 Tax=Xylaria flabelliformis TaxID=2512241 RepID=A0A553HN02_9PEZI|nr:hypothetical protein FHL15_009860 [Xylaria flabelliformis]